MTMMDGVNGGWMGAGGLVFIALVSPVIVFVSRGNGGFAATATRYRL